MFMWATIVNSLSQVADHPMLGYQGWSCPRVSYHAFERRRACFSYDISS